MSVAQRTLCANGPRFVEEFRGRDGGEVRSAGRRFRASLAPFRGACYVERIDAKGETVIEVTFWRLNSPMESEMENVYKFKPTKEQAQRLATSSNLLREMMEQNERLQSEHHFMRTTLQQIHQAARVADPLSFDRIKSLCAHAIAAIELRFPRLRR